MENGYYDGRTDEQLRSGGTAETDREAINDKIALYTIYMQNERTSYELSVRPIQ